MNKIFLFLLVVFNITFGQQKVELTNSGIEPIVTEIEGKSAEQLFLKTKEWIQLNYKNPSEVLKAEIKNENIRIDGFSKNFFYLQSLGKQFYDLEYTIEFSFKEGKYRFSFVGNRVTSKGQSVPFFTLPASFFKSDGKTIRNSYAAGYESYIQSVSNIYLSHYNYVTGKSSEIKNDW